MPARFCHPRSLVPRTFLATGALLVTLAACGAGDSDGNDSPRPAATAPTATGAASPPARAARLRLSRVGSFSSPTYVTAPPGDRSRIFVVEQGGAIRVVRNGRKLSRPFLDISGRVRSGGEQGLFSMAFAPDYATSRRFYVSYTDRDGNSRIVEYRRSGNPDRASPSTARQILFQRQPEANHNGGLVLFGPDRMLYIGLGDGGGANDRHGARGNGQDLGTLLGKILRIDPSRPGSRRAYRIPADNPFVGRSGARPEIYSYGLRNPWRFSFDRATADLTIGDVGQNAVEEIDFVTRGRGRGANFGWRVFEGNRRNYSGESAPGHVRPVITYGLGGGNCAVTGGYVVRDRSLGSLYGRYVYGDYCGGILRAVTLRPGRAIGNRSLGLRVPELSSFGEDAAGHVYATSLRGSVYRLVNT
jgi:glucose/arabinose dehydrogenase